MIMTQKQFGELLETKENTGIVVKHYSFVDDHFTWWEWDVPISIV